MLLRHRAYALGVSFIGFWALGAFVSNIDMMLKLPLFLGLPVFVVGSTVSAIVGIIGLIITFALSENAMTYAPRPTHRCPTCDSNAPHLHPAVQFEGEVEVCTDG